MLAAAMSWTFFPQSSSLHTHQRRGGTSSAYQRCLRPVRPVSKTRERIRKCPLISKAFSTCCHILHVLKGVMKVGDMPPPSSCTFQGHGVRRARRVPAPQTLLNILFIELFIHCRRGPRKETPEKYGQPLHRESPRRTEFESLSWLFYGDKAGHRFHQSMATAMPQDRRHHLRRGRLRSRQAAAPRLSFGVSVRRVGDSLPCRAINRHWGSLEAKYEQLEVSCQTGCRVKIKWAPKFVRCRGGFEETFD